MNIQNFTVDIENIKKAIITPALISAVLVFTKLIEFDLGYIILLILTFIPAFAGVNYMRHLSTSGKNYLLLIAGLNGSIVGGLAMFTYRLLNWLLLSIKYGDWSSSIGGALVSIIEAVFISFLAALAWHAYQNEDIS